MPVLERLKSMVEGRTVLETPDFSGNTRTESAALYRCPACETTFIATEKERCSRCDVDVREVPSAVEVGIDTGRQQ